ncbi:helix-turn-helix domain-containing protein [Microbacterium sp.]|uniref:TetR/AcrR family transcriptional regulator n=1 Tax=Microbacterium sp. TaxID=51671 RepID=UPI002E308F37|nr:helix-turn-helix domain-containing protein [Microbacterium sp.]HEX5728417.1 helix-turn-helix domain-containing protein [Microbacterium sp.]
MEPGVKNRRYDSPHRRAQAEATRRAILDSAQRLFERQGYSATSVPAIAEEAGVALKTIYVYFETKATVVHALWDARLGGDEAGIPVLERAWFRALVEEPVPERKLRLVAAQARRVKSRSGALLQVIRAAASADPDIASLWASIEVKLLDVQRAIVEQLNATGSLAASLDVARATDILWTLNHPDVWHLLVSARGWTGEEYERWMGDVLCSQLLATPGAAE